MNEARAERKSNMIDRIKSIFGNAGIMNAFKAMREIEDEEAVKNFNSTLSKVQSADDIKAKRKISRGQVAVQNIEVKQIIKDRDIANAKTVKRDGREH